MKLNIQTKDYDVSYFVYKSKIRLLLYFYYYYYNDFFKTFRIMLYFNRIMVS